MRPEHWLRDHLERKTEEYVAQGMTQEEARRRARLDLGGIEQKIPFRCAALIARVTGPEKRCQVYFT